jgi:DinB superfamily
MSVIDRLAAMPQTVRDLITRRSAEDLSRKPESGDFSLRENVLHLRDIDLEGFEPRVMRILSEENPFLPDVDGAKLAAERDYNAQPIAPALEAFAASRARSIARLRTLSDAELDRTGELEGVGRVTLRELLQRWLEHDAGHVREMEAL